MPNGTADAARAQARPPPATSASPLAMAATVSKNIPAVSRGLLPAVLLASSCRRRALIPASSD